MSLTIITLPRHAIIACLVAAMAPFATAQTTEPSPLRLDGFGTLGVVHSNEERADFVSSLLVPEGAGFSNQWSVKVDSKLGLQVSTDASSTVSGVVQVIFEQQYDGSYSPELEWANLNLNLSQDLELRAGRMVLPSFMTSEYRKVGYANATSRPPPEVYQLVPVSNIDGLSLLYRSRLDQATNTLQLVYGGKTVKAPSFEVEADNALTLANTLEWRALTVFASYTNTRLTIDAFDNLFNAYSAFGPAGEAIAQQFDIDDKRFEIMTLGGRYDTGDWFILGEWARNRSRTLVGDTRGWYLTGGYRFGPVTPYLTLARRNFYGMTSHPGLDIPQARPLNALLNEILADAAIQTRVAVGLRWDFAHSIALKMQYEHINLGAGSEGVLANDQPGFEPGGTVGLFSATLDFVF
ncbi:porin [Bowmanella dokdonensis]|uniref:Porin n=1 Tax=Bowmanella dokdonensis TaxID=751969 RepID=A0A939IR78_9ALTE|nr:porin [Bowmanella dokdonensis]MBN7825362.1 porin [Bowmanella dokdonensis]